MRVDPGELTGRWVYFVSRCSKRIVVSYVRAARATSRMRAPRGCAPSPARGLCDLTKGCHTCDCYRVRRIYSPSCCSLVILWLGHPTGNLCGSLAVPVGRQQKEARASRRRSQVVDAGASYRQVPPLWDFLAECSMLSCSWPTS